MIQINKKVKLPDSQGGRIPKYPFGQMAVGDSFEFPIADRQRLAMAAYGYGLRNGIKLTIRTIDKKTCGIWRIK